MKRAVMRFGDSAAREELGYWWILCQKTMGGGTGWGHNNILHKFEIHLPSGKLT